jgi:hypothetical protein
MLTDNLSAERDAGYPKTPSVALEQLNDGRLMQLGRERRRSKPLFYELSRHLAINWFPPPYLINTTLVWQEPPPQLKPSEGFRCGASTELQVITSQGESTCPVRSHE